MAHAGTILAPGAMGCHWSALETLPGQSLPGSGKFWDVNVFPLGPAAHFQDISTIPSPSQAFRPIDNDSGTRPLFASRLTESGQVPCPSVSASPVRSIARVSMPYVGWRPIARQREDHPRPACSTKLPSALRYHLPQDLASSNPDGPDHIQELLPRLVTRPSRPSSRLMWSDLTRCAMHRVLSIVYCGALYPTSALTLLVGG